MSGARLGRRLIFCALVLGVPSCAYYNSLYNAKRHFSEAQRAEARGETALARSAYARSLEGAARSLDRSSDGRWAGEALYIVGRSHLGRGDLTEARAALRRALSVARGDGLAPAIRTYLGVVEVRLGNDEEGLAHLDEALSSSGGDDAARAAAFLWRARARLMSDDTTGAWQDLGAAAASGQAPALAAMVDMASLGLASGEMERAAVGLAGLAATSQGVRYADSVRAMGRRAAGAWGHETAIALLDPFRQGAWGPSARDSLMLFQGELALEATDTAAAEAILGELSSSAGPAGMVARVRLARSRMARAADVSDLAEVRNLLLPALAHSEARAIVQDLKTLDVLVQRAQEHAQPLSYFAAAELARDRLEAPRLAARLFRALAVFAPNSPYAGKALLAALTLLPPESAEHRELRERIAGLESNIYLVALRAPVDDAEFAAMEDRLGRTVENLRATAAREAERRDALVVQTIAEMDSVAAAAAEDSMRLGCGLLLDSLGLTGLRGDSVGAACVRGDSARMDSILQGLLDLREPGRAGRDTVDRPLPPDSMPPPDAGLESAGTGPAERFFMALVGS